MPNEATAFAQDLALAERCRANDEAAWRELYAQTNDFLKGMLASRGAAHGPIDAEDFVADLWAKCVPGGNGRSANGSLLERYRGQCPLKAWLATVVKHAFIDYVRRAARRPAERAASIEAGGLGSYLDDGDRESGGPVEADRVREAILAGWHSLSAQQMLLLRLYASYQVTQQRLSLIYGVCQATISRHVEDAISQIRDTAVAHMSEFEMAVDWDWTDIANTIDLMAEAEIE